MIELAFCDASDNPAAVLEATDFRITGGVVWNRLEHGLVACYACGSWKHHGRYYPSISIAGASCLAFGIARDPLISEPIALFALTGTVLRANGVAVAEYDEKLDLWQGLIRPITWRAMRVVSAGAAAGMVVAGKGRMLNPWDYPADAPGAAISSSKHTT